MQDVENALLRDLIYRYADLYLRKWGEQLGVDTHSMQSSYYPYPGKTLIQTWASDNGIAETDAPFEMVRRLGLNLFPKQRLLLAEKLDAVRVGKVTSLQARDLPAFPLEELGFKLVGLFPYATPDGTGVSGGVAYLQNSTGNTIRFPVTPWKSNNQRVRWDWLSWGTPLPLYRMNELFAHPADTVFLLPTEDDVEWIVQNAACLASRSPLTTWPCGSRVTLQYTDWGVLASHKVVIVVRASAEGAQLANDVYRELEKAGIKQIGFALPEAQLLAQNTRHKWIAKVHDISRVILNQAPLRDTFLAFAEREFGLKLDPEREQALSLGDFLALSTSEVTWLIPDLLRVGDRVMLYGMAKSGKTTWLVHEALHMAANGHSVLYVDGEMSVADFQTRLNSGLAGAQLPEQFQILSSCALRRGLHLQDPETQAFVLQQTKKAEIVILDNLHALFPSSLQAGPESCEGLNNMVNTLHRSGKTVIVVHHTSRSGASFGSSVKELGLELLLKVTRTGRDITIKPEAARGLREYPV